MKMTTEQLKDLGYVEHSPGIYTRKLHPDKPAVHCVVVQPPKPPKRIRQSTKPLLNKLESEWLAELTARYPNRDYYAQSIKFRLANGLVYTPDFFNFQDFFKPTAWEVKGPKAWRGGFENLKVAAHQYPKIQWILVWKQDGKWQEQIALP